MARVLAASTPLGQVVDHSGNARSGVTVGIASLAGVAALPYAALTGASTVPAVTDAAGYVPGYLDPGTYLQTIDGETDRWEVGTGRSNVVIADIVGDNVVDDTAAIVAALDALPDYAFGVGGGTVVLPLTAGKVCKTTAAITVDDGQSIVGLGFQGPNILGNFAGPIFNVIGDYVTLEKLYAKNLSADPAARALAIASQSHFAAHFAHFHAVSVAGYIAYLNAALLPDFDHCEFGGAGATVCDRSIHAINGSNGLRLRATSIRDTKAGVYCESMHGLSISAGTQFESLGGAPVDGFYGAVALNDQRGGSIDGSYCEAVLSQPFVSTFNSVGVSRGLFIGGNYIETSGGAATGTINMVNASHSHVAPNAIYPGAGAPNVDGVVNNGAAAATNVVDPQYLASGTGLETKGGRIDRTGTGSPEGVLTAGIGSTWHRTDGGAGTCLYVKESGAGNVGWVAK